MNNFVNKTRISARKKFGFGSAKAKEESSVLARSITERKSVEWYMQHTLDVLNAGRKYSEQRLAQLSGRKLG